MTSATTKLKWTLLAATLPLVIQCTPKKTEAPAPAPAEQTDKGSAPETQPATDKAPVATNANTGTGAQTGPVPGAAPAAGTSGKINSGRDAETKINSGRDQAPAGAVPGAPGTPGTPGSGKRAAYKPAPTGYALANVTQWVTADQAKRPGMKYVFIPPEIVNEKDMVNTLRVAAGKMWNSLSFQEEIDVPEDVSDGAGLVFALSPAKLWGADGEKKWGYIAACTPKSNIQVSPAPKGLCTAFTAAEAAAVSIPRFVYNASNGGPYANVFQTPATYSAFTRVFKLSPIKFIATNKEAIVCGPRITAFRTTTVNGKELVYSYTSDEFDGRDNGNMKYTNAPTDQDQRQTGSLNAGPGDSQTAVASEWWMQLPNGFIYYSIHGEGAQERGKAEVPFAIDPANWKQNFALATGRSCLTCHATGVQAAHSDDAFAGKNGWSANADLDAFYKQIRDKFQGGLRKIVEGVSDAEGDLNERLISGSVEPISKAIMLIEGKYTGGANCSFFCGDKFGKTRRNLCETLPSRGL